MDAHQLWVISTELLQGLTGDVLREHLAEKEADKERMAAGNPLRPAASLHHPAPLVVDLDTRDPKWVDLFLQYFIQPTPPSTSDGCSGSASYPPKHSSVVSATGTTQNHRAESSTSHGMDDLLFFVRSPHPSHTRQESVFVKRKTGAQVPALDDLISWKETFFLNMIIQMSFDLTVSVCERKKHPQEQQQVPPSPLLSPGAMRRPLSSSSLLSLKTARKRVYASPNKTRMDKKSSHNDLSYPILYFCVDDFEDAFADLVVMEGQYLCVELSTELRQRRGGTPMRVPVSLFQGAVPFVALQQVYRTKAAPSFTAAPWKSIQRLSRSFFQQASFSAGGNGGSSGAGEDEEKDGDGSGEDTMHYILMRGPNGKGHAQAAVMAADYCASESVDADPSSNGNGEPVPRKRGLKCHLTYVNLPWFSIVRDLLAEVHEYVEGISVEVESESGETGEQSWLGLKGGRSGSDSSGVP